MGVMATDMLERWEELDILQLAGDIIDANREEIVELNKKQLRKGINNVGQQLSPRYSEDPWFKTAQAAKNYADWKKRLFPDMTYDIPNLIIIGVYHNSISMQRIGDSARFEASASFAASIAGKYNNTALGLNEEASEEAFEMIIKPPLVEQIADRVGAKTT